MQSCAKPLICSVIYHFCTVTHNLVWRELREVLGRPKVPGSSSSPVRNLMIPYRDRRKQKKYFSWQQEAMYLLDKSYYSRAFAVDKMSAQHIAINLMSNGTHSRNIGKVGVIYDQHSMEFLGPPGGCHIHIWYNCLLVVLFIYLFLRFYWSYQHFQIHFFHDQTVCKMAWL